MRPVFLAVAAVALACLLVRAGRLGMAGDYIDPIGKAGAHDEAIYAHDAIRMAVGGHGLAAVFEGPDASPRPPLLIITAGLAARVLGISRLTLRLPGVLLAAFAAGLVFWWTAEFQSWEAGLCAAALLISNHLWHSVASLCMADGPLVAFYVAALFCLFADPWLESKWSLCGFAASVGGGILVEGVAGLIPLAVLGLYWLAAPANYRPRFGRAMLAAALAAALAAPWYVYRLSVGGSQVLAAASGFPPQAPQQSPAAFYVTRLLFVDPLLFATAAVSLPGLFRDLRRRSAPAILLFLGLALPAIAALLRGNHNITDLLPLAPLMAVLAGVYNPVCLGRNAKFMAVVLLAAFVGKAALPEYPWGLSFDSGTKIAQAPLLSDYCEQARGNELILVNPADEFYASVLPLPAIHYVLPGAATQPGKSGMNFVPSAEDLALLVRAHPDSDFFLPESDRAAVSWAAQTSHRLVTISPGRFLLLSRHVLPFAGPRWTCRL